MQPMFSLEGKRAFITGAAGGIGRAVAERFIQAGASVVITDIVDSQAVATEIGAQFIQADVGSEESVASALKQAMERLGHRGIRINAVCPGYIDTAMGSGDEGKTLSEQFTALGRVGATRDLTGVFHFLAAEESAYMTGQALLVDGGWSCGPTPQVLKTLLGSATVS
jgi:NAD(P)-dependent dehydrogenase (short-subunit alcohol dehydrogenase family)